MSSELMPGFLEVLKTRRIHRSRRPLRTKLHDLEELMASITEKGLLQPILVRPSGKDFEVVAGNRRFEACKRLKIRKILCNVVDLDDKQAYEVSLVENVQHRTLDVIDEARAMKKYVDEYGYGGVSELARAVGKSEQYVSQRLQLLGLPNEVLQKVTTRVVTPSHARELVGLDERSQRLLADQIVENKLSSRELGSLVRQVKAISMAEPFPIVYEHSESERRMHNLDRVIDKYLLSLKVCLNRFDQSLDSLQDDEWIIEELLVLIRKNLNSHIDRLLKLRHRMHRYPPPPARRNFH